jgi:hypothetical protein
MQEGDGRRGRTPASADIRWGMSARAGGPRGRAGTWDPVVGLCAWLIVGTAALSASADPSPDAAGTWVAAAPLPGPGWTDPDSINWVDPPPTLPGLPAIRRPRLNDRLTETRPSEALSRPAPGRRILDRLRDRRVARAPPAGSVDPSPPTIAGDRHPAGGWPLPLTLESHLAQVAALAADEDLRTGLVAAWVGMAIEDLRAVVRTAGPSDPAAAGPLLALGEVAEAGLLLADDVFDPRLAAEVRRASLALTRRAAVWRAVATAWSQVDASRPSPSGDLAAPAAALAAEPRIGRLLESLEQFERAQSSADAAAVRRSLAAVTGLPDSAANTVARAVHDHYHAANVRVAVHEALLARMMPEATLSTGPLQDWIMGRQVRGTRTVEQSTAIRFVPDADAIRIELLINGDVASRTVTESGPVAFHSRGTGNFTVRKPVVLSAAGLDFGRSLGTASNRTQLANVRTSFDGVPIMGSLVRNIARNQHEEAKSEAIREVNARVVAQACREVDRQAEPRLREMADRVRERLWEPMVRLGLDPTPVGLSTTAHEATARLRLAGEAQLAAHTPRPRSPAESILSVQLHESAVNNLSERLELAGRRLRLEDLVVHVCELLAVPPAVPDDLPPHVEITFGQQQPLRISCRDGLVHVWVTIDTLDSGRRCWHDIVAHVAYKPVAVGAQVTLEREGPVQLSGPGHQGRIELALRTIFGKIFAKERPIRLLPEVVAGDPRLADLRAVQAVSSDGWLAVALAPVTTADSARPATLPPVSRTPGQVFRR